MFSGDFVKLTQAQSASGNQHGSGTDADDSWTDQEVLRLLEGVEMYDDDWSEIERHVGSRSAQQCIRKFLQLPIEDQYIATEGNMGPLRYARVPFEQADNPVMSVVAFLAGVVGPGVAAEAAKTALQELTDGDKKDNAEEDATGEEKTEETKESEGEADMETANEKAEDKMQEDALKEGDAAIASTSNATSPQPAATEEMAVDGEVSSATAKSTTAIPHSKVVRAANLALKSSAKAARELAEAEDQHIRSTLAAVIKLTLTKLELKMSQFEELEELLEDERKSLESARMSLVNERIGLRKTLETVKGELAKSQAGINTPGALVEAANQAQEALATSGTRVSEVQDVSIDGENGPVETPNIANLG